MQKFCDSCEYRKIPDSIKKKFNEYVKPLFFDCPVTKEHIAGCTVKLIPIDWKSFSRWLKDNTLLEEAEEKTMKVVGLYEDPK